MTASTTVTLRRWLADLAWLPGQGVCRDVLIEADGDRFTAVTPDATSAATTPQTPSVTSAPERLRGLTLPGFANAHSHAFHRALRGTTQADRGTFWTWRERMYQVAGRLDPDSYLTLARAVYAEMALAGIMAPVLPTGAGHDAGILAARIPTAMLFVRNPTGVSHSPAEHAEQADCEAGVHALALVLEDLAGRP